MKRLKILASLLVVMLVTAMVALPVSTATANGNETLNTIGGLAAGTGVVVAGVGLFGGEGILAPGTIDFQVPNNASVEQVLLYWQGRHDKDGNGSPPNPTTLDVDGNTVSGAAIGILDPFGGPGTIAAYRADITNLNLVVPGNNSLDISGAPFVDFLVSGAGVIVVFDDGTTSGLVDVRDGLDSAWLPATIPAERVTVPQVFNFDSADFSRIVSLTVIASEVGDHLNSTRFRTSTIRVTFDATVIDFDNILQLNDGAIWDTVNLNIDVPAGIDELTVELISGNDDPTVPDGFTSADPASLFWIASALQFPPGGTGRMTGGGKNIRMSDGLRITKGFTIHCDLLLSNNLEVNWPANKFHMTENTSAICLDTDADQHPPNAPFDTFIGVGTGKLNGVAGATIRWTFVDNGEPGKDNDEVAISIYDVDGNNVLYLPLEKIFGGNIQAHFDQPHR